MSTSFKQPPYKEALGIATGDVVSTSYGTGPYLVWSIKGPYTTERSYSYFAVWPYPVISLKLVETTVGDRVNFESDFYYINNVHREDERWFDDQRSEMFVRKPNLRMALQMDLFSAAEALPELYQFQEGARYDGGDGTIWKCQVCDRDFNATRTGPANPYHCGGIYPSLLFIVMSDTGHWSVYQRALGSREEPIVQKS